MSQMVAAKKKEEKTRNCGFTVMLFGGEVAEVRVFDVWSLATDPAAKMRANQEQYATLHPGRLPSLTDTDTANQIAAEVV